MASNAELKRRLDEAKEAWDRLSVDVAWASHHYFANQDGPPRIKEELAKDLMLALVKWRKAKERYERMLEECEPDEMVTDPGFGPPRKRKPTRE